MGLHVLGGIEASNDGGSAHHSAQLVGQRVHACMHAGLHCSSQPCVWPSHLSLTRALPAAEWSGAFGSLRPAP